MLDDQSIDELPMIGGSGTISVGSGTDAIRTTQNPYRNNAAMNEAENELIKKKEERTVLGIRILTFTVLFIAALALCISVYYFTSKDERTDFNDAFVQASGRVIDSIAIKIERRIQILSSFAMDIASYARASNSTWPTVTIPDFEKRGRIMIELSSLINLMIIPIVQDNDRMVWEEYSKHNNHWLADGLAFQEMLKNNSWIKPDNWTEMFAIKPYIHNMEKGNETASGPYTPIWEVVPSIPWPGLINYNLIQNPRYSALIKSCIETGKVVISRVQVPTTTSISAEYDDEEALVSNAFALFLERWEQGGNAYQDDPVSHLVFPIYANDYGVGDVVALIDGFIYWRRYFADILPEDDGPILCVLENTCGDIHSYKIAGHIVEYVGEGALYDKRYEDQYEEADFGSFDLVTGLLSESRQPKLSNEHCSYKFRLYPTYEMEDKYISRKPVVFTMLLAGACIFTTVIFLIYDCVLQRRQKMFRKKAIEAGAVVTSLFPKTVRDRMFQEAPLSNKSQNYSNHRLSSFLPTMQRKPSNAGSGYRVNGDDDNDDDDPIADLFENCTVLFADIVGFTSWSAKRQPTEVFKLLEAIYGVFDRTANKRNVFKIETIGDCYVAVTGLPQPQEDHAVIMTKFAQDCLRKMHQVVRRLTVRLGDDTSTLTMRFGLHSGAVTAGVLRGERARFQLFGDTVNTAARMEQNGRPGKVHLSETTALLLMKAGILVEEREDKIQAKGKGLMTTYWLIDDRQHRNPSMDSGSSETPSSGDCLIDETTESNNQDDQDCSEHC